MIKTVGRCQRCGKTKEILKFETVAQNLCVDCFKKVIRKKIRREFKNRTIIVVSMENKLYRSLVDFLIKIGNIRDLNTIDVQNKEFGLKTSDLLLPIPNDIISTLFLYGLFYDSSVFKVLDWVYKQVLPFKHFNLEEVKVINDVFNLQLKLDFFQFIEILQQLKVLSNINVEKIELIYEQFLEFTKQYLGLIHSTSRSVEKLSEMSLLFLKEN